METKQGENNSILKLSCMTSYTNNENEQMKEITREENLNLLFVKRGKKIANTI